MSLATPYQLLFAFVDTFGEGKFSPLKIGLSHFISLRIEIIKQKNARLINISDSRIIFDRVLEEISRLLTILKNKVHDKIIADSKKCANPFSSIVKYAQGDGQHESREPFLN